MSRPSRTGRPAPGSFRSGAGGVPVRRIGLVAHDGRKGALCEWVIENRALLVPHVLYATGTTGVLLRELAGVEVTCLCSGPLGGDLQIGSRIVEGEIDILIFFCDPLGTHPHDADVRALERIAVLSNIPTAYNRATADSIIQSVSEIVTVRLRG